MSQNEAPAALSPAQIDDLRQRALAAATKAYAPYSGFRVGAAVLLDDDTVTTGCNVENASFRLTTCAEQSAIAAAVALQGSTARLRAVMIVNLNHTASPPCGGCRQTILEFGSPRTEVFFPATDDSEIRSTITDLLPHAFLLEGR
ncbi:cytidine deaminase [Edaphobacter sp. 12200R-103]|uniref:cytidine deaminase n=1 Tax=Edaphobacter sp. 12200R-103 TaxID=2703788 RepID=UPI00138C0879|nr:cytidine deaminase [Edaphobacter sp. 12200R-103]QHS51469.1 cytidine deaminase [Edaphobacter sp. 12200R-103]